MIYDCLLYNGEDDVLTIHLGTLFDVVDHFFILEGQYTFQGTKRTLTLEDYVRNHPQYRSKITWATMWGNPDPNPWVNEREARNMLMEIPTEIAPQEDDWIIISDCDEIADPTVLERMRYSNYQYQQFVFETYCFYYGLNVMMDPPDVTTARSIVVSRKRQLTTPQGLRSQRLSLPAVHGGWHFSYLGGIPAIQNKLQAFSHAEYNSPYFLDPARLEEVIRSGRDLFDRDIHFRFVPIQSPTHPLWLIKNIESFCHLVV